MNTLLIFVAVALAACSASAIECVFPHGELTYIQSRAQEAKSGNLSAQYELGEYYLIKNAPEKALPYFEQSLQGRKSKGLPIGDIPAKIKRAKDMIVAAEKQRELLVKQGKPVPPKPEVPDIEKSLPVPNEF